MKNIKLIPVLFTSVILMNCMSDSEENDGYLSSEDPFYQECVDRVNEFRETEDLPALERNRDQEKCTSLEAKSDSESGQAHGSFGDCGERAQNECPGYHSEESTIQNCINQMWAEKDLGPDVPYSQNGHYLNMSNTSYKSMACGLYITQDSSVWMIQNFFPE